jgi:UDPglucose 6-dehydrogenase
LRDAIELRATVDEALAGADAVVVATEWPQFAQLGAARFTSLMRRAVVVDARRVLDRSVREDPGIAYFAIGLGAATV